MRDIVASLDARHPVEAGPWVQQYGVVDDLTELLEAIWTRATDPDRQSDMRRWSPLPAPASAAELAAAEARLGFPVPQVVRRVYGTIANGGFGPGYGLVGIGGGRTGFRSGHWYCENEYQIMRAAPQIRWPSQLLPVCDWGCRIYSCIDAADPYAPMFNVYGDALTDAPAHAITAEGCTFSEWLQAWVSGEDLWEAMTQPEL
jgi:hypothetical protein